MTPRLDFFRKGWFLIHAQQCKVSLSLVKHSLHLISLRCEPPHVGCYGSKCFSTFLSAMSSEV